MLARQKHRCRATLHARNTSGCSPRCPFVQAFQARIAAAPGQVVRYCRQQGAQPLWPQLAPVPSADDIPCCSRCGAPRQFEFQVWYDVETVGGAAFIATLIATDAACHVASRLHCAARCYLPGGLRSPVAETHAWRRFH